ncbi:HEPN domain-containing protein [Pantoea coffeiphila]|uniref:Uncharacterized protein n=1 Tax=Pantoea coffeiphila TaxID=1465635 RepID=A0A2S9I8F0_9GAMM|nr:HEPN domain-containing protein [Pantoea coffeiphila]PRD14004.1 hypothetical protein CQW29_18540 [Pantoea coffeiphila]
MKIEFLVLINNDNSFCNSKKSFIDFLQIDSQISISGKKLTYKQSAYSNASITVKFNVEMNNTPSNKERYFVIAIENLDMSLVDEFHEIGDKIKNLCNLINPGSIIVNTLWDDVGRHYASQAYPHINEVENIMRKLISKFMLINVGMDWSKETIHPELAKKIEKFDEDDTNLNDLYKIDFINLSDFLFDKKRDISIEDLDRVLLKTKFDESDKEKILKYVPKSNWDKYFINLLGEKSRNIESQWKLLYKLRNKVAHNRFLTKEDLKRIKGLTNSLKEILVNAMDKLGEIDLNDEDRSNIISSISTLSLNSDASLVEKQISDYYVKRGFDIRKVRYSRLDPQADFIFNNSTSLIAVNIKVYDTRLLQNTINGLIKKTATLLSNYIDNENINKGKLIIILVGDHKMTLKLNQHIDEITNFISKEIDQRITCEFGFINESQEYEILAKQ